jgi:hypothetical protein
MNQFKSEQILIIGAGKRVTQQLLPTLISIGISQKNLIIVRKEKKMIKEYPEIEVSCDLITTLKFFKGRLVFCCLDRNAYTEISDILLKIEDPKVIFFDTPIFRSFEKIIRLEKYHSLYVLEETILIPWIENFKQLFNTRGLVILWRMLYEYHGMALLKKLDENVRIKRIRFFNGKSLLVARVNKKLVISLGYYKVDKGNCKVLDLNISHVLPVLHSRWQNKVASNILNSREHFSILDMNSNLYKTLSKGKIYRNFESWKLLALNIGLANLINGESVDFPLVSCAYLNEKALVIGPTIK